MRHKSNAILEYGVVLAIAALFLIGINTFVRRHIEARVKHESDTEIGHALGLEWPEQTYTIGGTHSSYDRDDYYGGRVSRQTSQSDWSVTYSQPIPSQISKHTQAAMHVQDAAKTPPSIDYPDLQYNDWNDLGWPIV